MANISHMLDLTYGHIDICIFNIEYASYIDNEGEFLPDNIVNQCDNWEIKCCMITNKGKHNAQLAYSAKDCPIYIQDIMKLPHFNQNCIVLTNPLFNQKFDLSHEVVFYEMFTELAQTNNCQNFIRIRDRKHYYVTVEDKAYNILYIQLKLGQSI